MNEVICRFQDRIFANAFAIWFQGDGLNQFMESKPYLDATTIEDIVIPNYCEVTLDSDSDSVSHYIDFTNED